MELFLIELKSARYLCEHSAVTQSISTAEAFRGASNFSHAKVFDATRNDLQRALTKNRAQSAAVLADNAPATV